MKKIALGLLTLAVTASWAATASADYIGQVIYQPGSTSLGNYGNVTIFVWTGPNHSGGLVGAFYVCSSGATAGICTSSNSYLAPNADVMASMAAQASQAAGWSLPMNVSTSGCKGGGTGCLQYINYNSF